MRRSERRIFRTFTQRTDGQMEFFRWNIAAMLVGLALDFLIGDPEGWPHPVIFIG